MKKRLKKKHYGDKAVRKNTVALCKESLYEAIVKETGLPEEAEVTAAAFAEYVYNHVFGTGGRFLGYQTGNGHYLYGYGAWIVPRWNPRRENHRRFKTRLKNWIWLWLDNFVVGRDIDGDIEGLSYKWKEENIRCESYDWTR